MTTEHATTALTNPKDFFLNGRKLVVEYASPEAVRRGGGGPRGEKGGERPARDRDTHTEGGAGGQQRRARVRPARKREPAEGEREDEPEKPVKRRKVEEAQTAPVPAARERRTKSFSDRDSKSSKTRAKPGAALAMAKRETTSIVPSQGKKIVF